MKKVRQILILIILIYLIVLAFGINYSRQTTDDKQSIISENTNITVKFFYAPGCGHCIEKEPIIDQIYEFYSENISLIKLNYLNFKEEFYSYGFSGTPGLVISNQTHTTTFNYSTMSYENVNKTIYAFVQGKDVQEAESELKYTVSTPFGTIDLSDYSLPVLTVVLGALDSINPCSFFILLVLLSLLLNAKSRKKMIIIGGIFIFFSGLIYFILMSLLLTTVQFVDQPFIISIIAGIVAIALGLINIKDFFFYKKGVSLSMSAENKKKLFAQMRNLIKIEYLPAMIAGTIILAITANTYELACTLGLPVVFTEFLILYEITGMQAYFYILLYNLIYVIPLILIVSVFVITLGKRKLSEDQGRTLKLVSGLMMFSFGEVFLINANLLRDIFSVVYILLGSIIFALIVSIIWDRFEEKTQKK